MCARWVQVFVIGPDRRLKLSMLYPTTTGRNFEYVLTAPRDLLCVAITIIVIRIIVYCF